MCFDTFLTLFKLGSVPGLGSLLDKINDMRDVDDRKVVLKENGRYRGHCVHSKRLTYIPDRQVDTFR